MQYQGYINARSKLAQSYFKAKSTKVLTRGGDDDLRGLLGRKKRECIRKGKLNKPEGHPVKLNAHLYLPWSLIDEFLASSKASKVREVRPTGPGVPVASIEQIEGGCVLYRLLRPDSRA
jgi:hypothetical protein